MPKGRLAWYSFAAACLAFSVTFAEASDWTRFRGPNGTGASDDKGIPVHWTDQNILWKIKLPGGGHSSPILWKKQLYVQVANKDGSERSLVCLDVKDGSTKWTRPMPYKPVKAPLAKGKHLLHDKNSYASSSPAVDGEHVYVIFWDNLNQYLHAYTHAGEPVWSRELGPFYSEHGPGASPIPIGDKVIVADDQDADRGKSVLTAFDAKTGKPVWSQDRPSFRACYASPFLRDLPDGRKELIVVSTMGLTGYDPDTGSKHWNWEWKFTAKMPLRTTASPLYANGMLYAFSGDGGGPRHTVAVKLDGTPKLVWESTKTDFPYVPTPVLHGRHLYFVNDKGIAGCVEAETGKRIWFERLDAEFISSPVLIDGKIYAANDVGDVYVLAASPNYQLLAKNSLGELVRATPAVADNRLYIRGQQHLFCIGKK